MQKILIPTDFSPVADNALDYAIEIAAPFKSELYLYHVFTIHKVDYNWDFPEDEQPYKRKLEKKMELTKLKFLDKITRKGLSIETIVEEGNISSIFKRKVAKHEINLIIMGSKGASGLEKVIFGSVAAAALQKTTVPVLVVPPEHPFLPLEQIVLATDLHDVPPNVLSPLQKLASKFGAKVIILHVNTGSGKDQIAEMDLTLEDVETTYQEVPLSDSINESINEFIENNKCDLLCMIRREKVLLESIFQRSITKNQVYNSKTPLLVLPEN